MLTSGKRLCAASPARTRRSAAPRHGHYEGEMGPADVLGHFLDVAARKLGPDAGLAGVVELGFHGLAVDHVLTFSGDP